MVIDNEPAKPARYLKPYQFMDLISFPKLSEIQAVAMTDPEVAAAWRYAEARPEIDMESVMTAGLLGLLGIKGLLVAEEIQSILNGISLVEM